MMPKLRTSELLTVAAAAAVVGVPERTLRDAVAHGDVPHRLIAGRLQVVKRADAEAWAANRPRHRGRPARAKR
jgi:hypothetical protein